MHEVLDALVESIALLLHFLLSFIRILILHIERVLKVLSVNLLKVGGIPQMIMHYP